MESFPYTVLHKALPSVAICFVLITQSVIFFRGIKLLLLESASDFTIHFFAMASKITVSLIAIFTVGGNKVTKEPNLWVYRKNTINTGGGVRYPLSEPLKFRGLSSRM